MVVVLISMSLSVVLALPGVLIGPIPRRPSGAERRTGTRIIRAAPHQPHHVVRRAVPTAAVVVAVAVVAMETGAGTLAGTPTPTTTPIMAL